MTQNMTKGSPGKQLLVFMLPILAGGLVAQGYSMADAIIVGQAIGVDGFAAIGAVSNIDGLIIGFGMMMLQGFAVLIAQRFGADDTAGLRKTVAHSFLLTLCASLLLMAVGLCTLEPFMRLLRTPQALWAQARHYMTILLGWMAVPLLTHMGYATLRSLGDSRTPLIAMILSSLLNIALDSLLILGLRMGIGAAAAATILAQLLLWPWLFLRMRRISILRLSISHFRPETVWVRPLLKLSLPLALQNSVALVGIILLQAVVNGFGVLPVAAFGAAIRILYFMKAPSEAMQHALAAYVGQNAGAKDLGRIRAGVRAAMGISGAICGAAMLVMLVFGRQITGWVVGAAETETIRMAYQILCILAGMLPVLYLMYILRAALQGMGYTLTLMISGAVEMVLRSVCALTLPALWGLMGVGIAETSAWLGAALLYIWRYAAIMRRRGPHAA